MIKHDIRVLSIFGLKVVAFCYGSLQKVCLQVTIVYHFCDHFKTQK